MTVKKSTIHLMDAVEYSYPIPGEAPVTVTRAFVSVGKEGGLKFDPNNPRLFSDLNRENLAGTQENLFNLLKLKASDLLKSFPITGMFSQPLLADFNGIIKEGNRRLCACRLLAETDPRFQMVPVEILPANLTESQIRAILAIRHVKSEVKWQPRDEWRVIDLMINKDKRNIDEIAQILDITPQYIQDGLQAKEWYDEFDAYAKKQTKTEDSLPDEKKEKLWTYFWKFSTTTKFKKDVLSDRINRTKIYKWMYQKQFNDCTNILNITKHWYKPLFQDVMDQGYSFKKACQAVDGEYVERRSNELYKDMTSVRSRIIRMTKKDKNWLASEYGKKDLAKAKELCFSLQSLIAGIGKDEDDVA